MPKKRKYIKKKNYFIGGLIAAGLAMKAIRKKKDADKEAEEKGSDGIQGGGKILKVKVIGEGGGSQSTAKKTADAAAKAKDSAIEPVKAGANDTTKMKKGGMAKCRKYVKGGNVKTMEQDLLDGAGVSTSKRHKNKMRGVLHSKEEALYTALGRKAPKRNVFKKGGSIKRKYIS